MSRETDSSITRYHFPAKFCIARPAPERSGKINEYYNVDTDSWGERGSLWRAIIYLPQQEGVV
jgi:hypothetical protein